MQQNPPEPLLFNNSALHSGNNALWHTKIADNVDNGPIQGVIPDGGTVHSLYHGMVNRPTILPTQSFCQRYAPFELLRDVSR